jgi:hypothetical protein
MLLAPEPKRQIQHPFSHPTWQAAGRMGSMLNEDGSFDLHGTTRGTLPGEVEVHELQT